VRTGIYCMYVHTLGIDYLGPSPAGQSIMVVKSGPERQPLAGICGAISLPRMHAHMHVLSAGTKSVCVWFGLGAYSSGLHKSACFPQANFRAGDCNMIRLQVRGSGSHNMSNDLTGTKVQTGARRPIAQVPLLLNFVPAIGIPWVSTNLSAELASGILI
jgi:hypothetical protein